MTTTKKDKDAKYQINCKKCRKEQEFKKKKVFNAGGAFIGFISSALGVVTGPKIFMEYFECLTCGQSILAKKIDLEKITKIDVQV